jgi:hypothetical protein
MDDASGAVNMQVEDEEELEEATAAKATALLAIETSGVYVEKLHALLGSTAVRRHDRVQSGSGRAAFPKCMGSEGECWRGCGE